MAEWIYGRRTVAEHLDAAPGTCRRLLVAEGSRPPADLLQKAEAASLRVEPVARRRLDELSRGASHQGVCLEVGGWDYRPLEELVGRAREPGRLPLLIALDCVQDPRNLGAVLRVADGVGAAGVVVPKDRSAGLGPAAARTASGALATVPVARVTNLARTLDALRGEGFEIVGTAGDAPEDLYRSAIALPAVLVLGGEQGGIRPNVLKRSDRVVSIPLLGTVSSLNVAVSCGVITYELLRRTRTAEEPTFSA